MRTLNVNKHKYRFYDQIRVKNVTSYTSPGLKGHVQPTVCIYGVLTKNTNLSNNHSCMNNFWIDCFDKLISWHLRRRVNTDSVCWRTSRRHRSQIETKDNPIMNDNYGRLHKLKCYVDRFALLTTIQEIE